AMAISRHPSIFDDPVPTNKNTLIPLLRTRRHIHTRILGEKIDRFQSHRHLLARHDRPVLHAGSMRRTKSMPHDNILVSHRRRLVRPDFLLALLDPTCDAPPAERLHGVFPTCEELVLVVFRDP